MSLGRAGQFHCLLRERSSRVFGDSDYAVASVWNGCNDGKTTAPDGTPLYRLKECALALEHRAQLQAWGDSGDPILVAEALRQLTRRIAVELGSDRLAPQLTPLYRLALWLSGDFARLSKTILRLAMTFSQDDWYQQRYGSAQAHRRQRQLYAARSARYDEIKEYHQEKRQTYQNNAVAVFAEHGIAYEVRGHSWLCQIGTQAIYYWPKSGRWRVKGQKRTWGSYGAQDFLRKIDGWQRRSSQP